MKNTKSLMIDMHSKYAVKPDIAALDISETYAKEEVLPEDGL